MKLFVDFLFRVLFLLISCCCCSSSTFQSLYRKIGSFFSPHYSGSIRRHIHISNASMRCSSIGLIIHVSAKYNKMEKNQSFFNFFRKFNRHFLLQIITFVSLQFCLDQFVFLLHLRSFHRQ